MEKNADLEKALHQLKQQVSLILYMSDSFVDLIRIDDYLYYVNKLDHVYETWKQSSHCTINYRLPEDFSPCLQPFPNCADVGTHQIAAKDPIIFTFCHYWKHGLDFTYFDVGANYGMTLIPPAGFIRRMGRQNRCVAMEPGVAGNLLEYSVELNGLADVVTIDRRAADIRTGSVLIHSMVGHSASNSLLEIHRHFPIDLVQSTVVRSVKLDEILTGSNGIIAKIDTEGNDFRVLRGMEQTIRDKDVCALFEFNPTYTSEFADPAEEMTYWSRYFELYSIYPDAPPDSPLSKVQPVRTIDSFVNEVRSNPRGWVDILAVKRTLPGFDEFRDLFERYF